MNVSRVSALILAIGALSVGGPDAATGASISANPDLGLPSEVDLLSRETEDNVLVTADVESILGEDEILDLFTVGASFNRFHNNVRKTTSVSEVMIGSVPIVLDPVAGADAAGGYLELLFDIRESEKELETIGGIVGARQKNAVDSIIDQLVFEVNGTTIFDADLADSGALVVLDTALTGNSLLSGAPDLAFYIPVTTVMDVGTTTSAGGFDSSDLLQIRWRQNEGSGLNERWVLRGCGEGEGFAGECYSASFSLPAPLIVDDDIMAMPIPGGLPLMLSGLAGIALIARRRRA